MFRRNKHAGTNLTAFSRSNQYNKLWYHESKNISRKERNLKALDTVHGVCERELLIQCMRLWDKNLIFSKKKYQLYVVIAASVYKRRRKLFRLSVSVGHSKRVSYKGKKFKHSTSVEKKQTRTVVIRRFSFTQKTYSVWWHKWFHVKLELLSMFSWSTTIVYYCDDRRQLIVRKALTAISILWNAATVCHGNWKKI